MNIHSKPTVATVAVLFVLCSVFNYGQPSTQAAPVNIHELSKTFQSLTQQVGPAVVEILATGYRVGTGSSSPGSLLTRQRTTGSGVTLSPDGYCVTNAHVVVGRDSIKALLAIPADRERETKSILKAQGKIVEAKLVGIDLETDLAVLKLNAENLPYLELGDSDELGQGEIILAMGSPLGLDNSVSMGVVSSLARQLKPDDPVVYIQTDATINPGNSGGPLISTDGKVVGINTFILSQSGGNEGLGFAIPSNIVNHVYKQIRAHGRVRRGEIGINTQTITPELASALQLRKPWGAIISDVRPGSPADTADLKIGDIILSLDDKTIENARQFDVNLYRKTIGSQVNVKVLRSLQTPTISVRVVERFSAKDQFVNLVNLQDNLVQKLGILGVDVEPKIAAQIPSARGQNGVLVAALSPSAIRWSGNLQPGDVIYSVSGRPVTNLEGLRSLVEGIEEGEPLAIQVLREGVLRFVAFEMD